MQICHPKQKLWTWQNLYLIIYFIPLSMEFSRTELGVGSQSLLWGLFSTWGWNPGLPHCRWILYHLSHQRSRRILEWIAYPFSSGSSWPRNPTRVSSIAGGFFTSWATTEFLNNSVKKEKLKSSILERSRSVVSDSLQSCGLYLPGFSCPWDSPGKNIQT